MLFNCIFCCKRFLSPFWQTLGAELWHGACSVPRQVWLSGRTSSCRSKGTDYTFRGENSKQCKRKAIILGCAEGGWEDELICSKRLKSERWGITPSPWQPVPFLQGGQPRRPWASPQLSTEQGSSQIQGWSGPGAAGWAAKPPSLAIFFKPPSPKAELDPQDRRQWNLLFPTIFPIPSQNALTEGNLVFSEPELFACLLLLHFFHLNSPLYPVLEVKIQHHWLPVLTKASPQLVIQEPPAFSWEPRRAQSQDKSFRSYFSSWLKAAERFSPQLRTISAARNEMKI